MVLGAKKGSPNESRSLFPLQLGLSHVLAFTSTSPATWIALSLGATLGICTYRVKFRIPLLLTYMLLNCHLYKGESISLLRFIWIPKDLHAELLEGRKLNLCGLHASTQPLELQHYEGLWSLKFVLKIELYQLRL